MINKIDRTIDSFTETIYFDIYLKILLTFHASIFYFNQKFNNVQLQLVQ